MGEEFHRASVGRHDHGRNAGHRQSLGERHHLARSKAALDNGEVEVGQIGDAQSVSQPAVMRNFDRAVLGKYGFNVEGKQRLLFDNEDVVGSGHYGSVTLEWVPMLSVRVNVVI